MSSAFIISISFWNLQHRQWPRRRIWRRESPPLRNATSPHSVKPRLCMTSMTNLKMKLQIKTPCTDRYWALWALLALIICEAEDLSFVNYMLEIEYLSHFSCDLAIYRTLILFLFLFFGMSVNVCLFVCVGVCCTFAPVCVGVCMW